MSNNNSPQTSWVLEIPDDGLTENFTKSIQTATVPSIRIEPSRMTNNQYITTNAEPSPNFQFTPLNIRFIIDSEWKSYVEVYKWMVGLSNYKTGKSTEMVDGMNNTKPQNILLHAVDPTDESKILLTFEFYGAWPSEISDATLDYTIAGNPVLTSNVIILYKKFNLSDKNGNPIGERDPIAAGINNRG